LTLLSAARAGLAEQVIEHGTMQCMRRSNLSICCKHYCCIVLFIAFETHEAFERDKTGRSWQKWHYPTLRCCDLRECFSNFRYITSPVIEMLFN